MLRRERVRETFESRWTAELNKPGGLAFFSAGLAHDQVLQLESIAGLGKNGGKAGGELRSTSTRAGLR
jgi:hypothetical protein